MTVTLRRIDHVVLTVADLAATIAFYERALGMRHVVSGDRHALHFGESKINLHPEVNDFPAALKAAAPTLGSADLCLVADGPIEAIVEHLRGCDVDIVDGPVPRDGALGAMTSVYVRDPDANLVEVSVYA